MKEFYKWRGIISSQESAVEEPLSILYNQKKKVWCA